MGRKPGSGNGIGLERGRRWAKAFGSSPQLAEEVLAVFRDYRYIQALERVLSNSGIVLERSDFDGKRKMYALSPAQVDELLKDDLS